MKNKEIEELEKGITKIRNSFKDGKKEGQLLTLPSTYKLEILQAKLQVHKSYQEKIKKLKDFCDGLLKEIKHPAPRLAILNIKERIDKIMRGKE